MIDQPDDELILREPLQYGLVVLCVLKHLRYLIYQGSIDVVLREVAVGTYHLTASKRETEADAVKLATLMGAKLLHRMQQKAALNHRGCDSRHNLSIVIAAGPTSTSRYHLAFAVYNARRPTDRMASVATIQLQKRYEA